MISFYIRHSFIWEYLILFAEGLLLILLKTITNIIGINLLASVWFIQKQRIDDSGQGDESNSTVTTL